MTLTFILVSARVQQQFNLIVNRLQGDGEALMGIGEVFRVRGGQFLSPL